MKKKLLTGFALATVLVVQSTSAMACEAMLEVKNGTKDTVYLKQCWFQLKGKKAWRRHAACDHTAANGKIEPYKNGGVMAITRFGPDKQFVARYKYTVGSANSDDVRWVYTADDVTCNSLKASPYVAMVIQ